MNIAYELRFYGSVVRGFVELVPLWFVLHLFWGRFFKFCYYASGRRKGRGSMVLIKHVSCFLASSYSTVLTKIWGVCHSATIGLCGRVLSSIKFILLS